jgi:hypothetical protein
MNGALWWRSGSEIHCMHCGVFAGINRRYVTWLHVADISLCWSLTWTLTMILSCEQKASLRSQCNPVFLQCGEFRVLEQFWHCQNLVYGCEQCFMWSLWTALFWCACMLSWKIVLLIRIYILLSIKRCVWVYFTTFNFEKVTPMQILRLTSTDLLHSLVKRINSTVWCS